MTKLAYYTPLELTDTLGLWRDNINSALGLARFAAVLAKSADYTLAQDADVVVCDATGGAFTITLPASPSTGDTYAIIKKDSSVNAVTIGGNGKLINGASTASLASQYATKRVVYTGSEWLII